jgi:hypothetical protein
MLEQRRSTRADHISQTKHREIADVGEPVNRPALFSKEVLRRFILPEHEACDRFGADQEIVGEDRLFFPGKGLSPGSISCYAMKDDELTLY